MDEWHRKSPNPALVPTVSAARRRKEVGANAVGTQTIGSLALAAVAIGALAIRALAIGRLSIGRAPARWLPSLTAAIVE